MHPVTLPQKRLSVPERTSNHSQDTTFLHAQSLVQVDRCRTDYWIVSPVFCIRKSGIEISGKNVSFAWTATHNFDRRPIIPMQRLCQHWKPLRQARRRMWLTRSIISRVRGGTVDGLDCRRANDEKLHRRAMQIGKVHRQCARKPVHLVS